MSEGIKEEDVIISLLAKYFLLKVIKAVILYIDTYVKDMIEVENENKNIKNKYKWSHCNNVPTK